jgi:hypothetical protein
LSALDLNDQNALSAGGQGDRQSGGASRLSGAALARHDVQAPAGEPPRRQHYFSVQTTGTVHAVTPEQRS